MNLFPAHGSTTGAFSGPGIGFGFLSPYRQSLTMAPATIAAKIHKPLDIHGHFSTPVTLYDIIAFDHCADAIHIVAAEVVTIHRVGKINRVENLPGRGQADTVNIGQGPIHVLVFGKVNSCYTCQDVSPLLCFPDG
jgi:hypothetical protein